MALPFDIVVTTCEPYFDTTIPVLLASMREAGVHTLCIGKRGRWDLLGFFFRLAKAARSVRPEVLHGYLSESNLMALFLKPVCGFPRVVWGVRDSQTDAHLWGMLGKLSFRLNCLLARQNRISRPYGAVFSPKDLKTRILRAFLLEESKRAKQIIKEKKSAEPKKAKVQSKDAKPKQAAAKKPAQKK